MPLSVAAAFPPLVIDLLFLPSASAGRAVVARSVIAQVKTLILITSTVPIDPPTKVVLAGWLRSFRCTKRQAPHQRVGHLSNRARFLGLTGKFVGLFGLDPCRDGDFFNRVHDMFVVAKEEERPRIFEEFFLEIRFQLNGVPQVGRLLRFGLT